MAAMPLAGGSSIRALQFDRAAGGAISRLALARWHRWGMDSRPLQTQERAQMGASQCEHSAPTEIGSATEDGPLHRHVARANPCGSDPELEYRCMDEICRQDRGACHPRLYRRADFDDR